MTEVLFPRSLDFLFQPARYKVAHGGRGSGKSWGVARALLILGAGKKLRILCCREIQNSIAESVHQLLADQIGDLGLAHFYDIGKKEILGKNGTQFFFAGLKHNIQSIKSKEGIDIVWIEEAQTVSKNSWATLTPTIRKDGSEIWVTFNPELDTDETYTRFVLNPPKNSLVRKVNWTENPWFPDVLREEMLELRDRDFDAYLNVWEGNCKAVVDGAIYANEIRTATLEGRICRVPYNAAVPVNVYMDLGRRDMTSIWFVQQVGLEHRVLDFYQNRGHHIGHYIKAIRERPYVIGEVWLPHDAEQELLASELTIRQQMSVHFDVRMVPNIRVADGIEAARGLFPRCWFDEEKTKDGLQCLRRYRYDVDPDTGQYSKQPLHDDFSHGGDAFRYFAVAMSETSPGKEEEDRDLYTGDGGWLG